MRKVRIGSTAQVQTVNDLCTRAGGKGSVKPVRCEDRGLTNHSVLQVSSCMKEAAGRRRKEKGEYWKIQWPWSR